MTTNISPALNRCSIENPAEIAQNKYTQQLWKERHAYITMVAFTALAAIANYFLNPLVLPLTLVYVNFGILSLASNFVIPRVLEWFAEARKLKTQGDRETKIDEKLQELRAMRYADVTDLYRKHYMNTLCLSLDRQTATEYPLMARVCYWSDQSEELKRKSVQLTDENKCREAFEADLSSLKAKLKAAYYAALISHPNHLRKFKDTVAWTEKSLEQLAFQFTCNRADAEVVAKTKADNPKPICKSDIEMRSIGRLAMLVIQDTETSSSDDSD